MSKAAYIFIIQMVVILIIIFKILPSLDDKEILLISEPLQTKLNNNADREISYEGKHQKVNIEKLASYKISAVVKGKRYYFFDPSSEVSPMDLVLAWGKLDSEEWDKHIRYSQSSRWYFYRYDCDSNIDGDYVRKNSANVHIIPKDSAVLKKLLQIHKEDYVTLKGYLVSVHFSENKWTSSLSRNDTGNGACEIMYVEDITFED